jgi:hypothetical protein
MAAFQEAVRALPLEVEREPTPQVAFTTLRGDRIEATYGEPPVVNGQAVDYAGWPRYDGPFVRSADGGRTVTLRHGERRRILDFEAGTITDQPDAPCDA